MEQIFFSYSRKNSDCVLRVAQLLEADGYHVWLDVKSIPGGDEWGIKILEGINAAKVTLIFWSAEAAASGYVKQEYEMAVQKKIQKPNDHRRVICVLLDATPMPDLLSSYQAIKLFNCTKNEINVLIRELAGTKELKYRKFIEIDPNRSAKDFDGMREVSLLPDVVAFPFMHSVHCQGEIITTSDMTLADILGLPDEQRVIQVYLHFMFAATDEQSLKQVYQAIEKENAKRTAKNLEPFPFYMLHITGPKDETSENYSLGDSEDGFWQGQWLDAVKSTQLALNQLIGQNGATIQLFNAVPASLNFAIGMQLFKYWQLQLYHHTRDRRYQLVIETEYL